LDIVFQPSGIAEIRGMLQLQSAAIFGRVCSIDDSDDVDMLKQVFDLVSVSSVMLLRPR
jgi:hypothetical protein